jgi:hypothetical protein
MTAILPRALVLAVLMGVLPQPLPAETPAPVLPASDLDGLRSALERSLAGAGRPALFHPAEAASHVYRLKGYGALIVLTPRTFVAPRSVVRRVGPPAAPRRATPPENDRPIVIEIPEGTFEVAVPDLRELQHEMESQMAAQAAALRDMEKARDMWARGSEEDLQAHLRIVEEQAEAFRVEAERAREQMERDVWTRLAPPPAPAPPIPPSPPVRPMPPADVQPMIAPERPQPPEPKEPPPPPWRFWFDTRQEEPPADTKTIVEAVREAVVAGLESYRRPLSSLRPEDVVTVAVDVVPDGFFRRVPGSTVLVRVRARDLQERRAGRLTAAQLRERLEFEED